MEIWVWEPSDESRAAGIFAVREVMLPPEVLNDPFRNDAYAVCRALPANIKRVYVSHESHQGVPPDDKAESWQMPVNALKIVRSHAEAIVYGGQSRLLLDPDLRFLYTKYRYWLLLAISDPDGGGTLDKHTIRERAAQVECDYLRIAGGSKRVKLGFVLNLPLDATQEHIVGHLKSLSGCGQAQAICIRSATHPGGGSVPAPVAVVQAIQEVSGG